MMKSYSLEELHDLFHSSNKPEVDFDRYVRVDDIKDRIVELGRLEDKTLMDLYDELSQSNPSIEELKSELKRLEIIETDGSFMDSQYRKGIQDALYFVLYKEQKLDKVRAKFK
jgi:hypothetical protein